MASAGDSLRRLATRAERLERQWPSDAAQLVERSVARSLTSATGDGSFSHGRDMGRATVTVRRRGDNTTSVEAAGSMAVWAIVERGTRAHVVDAGAGRVLRTPRGPRRRVRVSGVRGRRTWSAAVTAAGPAVKASAAQAVRGMVAG